MKKGIEEICTLNEDFEERLQNSEAEKKMIEEGKDKLKIEMNDLNEKHTQLLASKDQDDKEIERLKNEVQELKEAYKRFSTNELSLHTLALDMKVIKSVEVKIPLTDEGFYGLGYRIGNTVVLRASLSDRYHNNLRFKVEKNCLR